MTDIHTVLYRIKPRKTEKELVAWDVGNYCTNVDGSRVLYTRHQDALYVWSPSKDDKRICDAILPETLTVTADDVFYFYREDGVLAVSDNGGEVRTVATGVGGYLTDAHSIFYVVTGEDGKNTIYVNYRNARVSDELGNGFTDFD